MIRKLVLFAVLVAFATNSAYGVGLGDLELDSALNQTFDAEIALVNTEGLEIDEILPNLASQADFTRVGVERSDILLDLRFKVVPQADDKLVVKISSNKPIIEPYLNFLVEVLWPNGRLLREYTVLLDPPVFGDEGIEPVQPAQTESTVSQAVTSPRQQSSSGTAAAADRSVSGTVSMPSQTPKPASGAEVVEDEYGVTGTGDTLWAIATRVRPDASVSIQQTMLALQRTNPEAFIRENINLLKAGYVLRIPDIEEIQAASRQSAIAEVQHQNDAWKQYKSGESAVAQLDASSHREQAGASEAGGEEGELKLLTADSREGQRAGSGTDESSRVSELNSKLAGTLEDLDRTRRANADLNVRMDDLAGQIQTLTQLVQLKDDQLAELQTQLKQVQALAAKSALAEPEAPAAPESSLMSNPLVLGSLLVLIILIIAGVLILRRRKGASADDLIDEDLDRLAEPDADITSVMGTTEADTSEESPQQSEQAKDEDVSPQTADVLSEVDIYLAYGRFPQAVTFLKNAISSEPERTDIQLKLLEVYVQTEETSKFNLLYATLQELGDPEASEAAAALQAKLPGAAEEAEAAMGETVISSEPVAAIEEPAEDDDLSFDLDDLDSETDDLGLDLDDLDLDEDSDENLDLEEETLDLEDTDADDLGSDLDAGEEDLDLGEDSEPVEEVTAEDDADLDLGDLDLDDLDLGSDEDLDLEDSEPDLETDTSTESDELSLDDDFSLDEDDAGLELEDVASDLETDTSTESDELSLDDDFSLDDDVSLDLDDSGPELETDSSTDSDELSLDDDFSLDEISEPEAVEESTDDDLDLGDLDLDDDLNLDDDLDLDDSLSLDLDEDDDIEEDAGSKLDLARAYIDMGDNDGARGVLEDVMKSGAESEQQEAEELLSKMD